MSNPVIDLRIIASTTNAEAGLKRVGTEAEQQLGAGGKLGKAGGEAEGALGGVGSKAGKAGADVKKGMAPAEKAFKDTGKGASGLLTNMTGISLQGGAVIAAFAAVGFAAKGVLEEYNKNVEANLMLNQAMKNSGEKVTPAWTKALEAAQKGGENLGFQQSDTTQALANLSLAGIKQKDMLSNLTIIQDLARAKNMSLADAAEVVIKAVNGQTRGLKDYNVTGLYTLPTTAAVAAAAHKLATAKDKAAAADANFAKVSRESGVLTEKSRIVIERAALAHEKYDAAVAKYGANSKQAQSARLAEMSSNVALQNLHDTGAKKYADALAKQVAADAAYKAQLEKVNTTANVAWVRASNLKNIHEELAKRVGGQASAATHSLGVEWQIVSARFNDIAGTVIPHIQAVAGAFFGFIGSVIVPALVTLAPLIGAVVAAITAWIVVTNIASWATKIWTGVQAAFNAVMSINPFILWVAAIAIVIGAFILLYTHVKGFREIVQHVVAAVLGFFKTAFAILVPIFRTVFGIIGQIVGTVVGVIIGYFKIWIAVVNVYIHILVGVFTVVFDIISSVVKVAMAIIALVIWGLVTALSPILKPVIGFFSAVFGKAFGYVSGGIGAAKALISGLVGFIGPIIGAIGKIIGGIGGFFSTAFGTVKGIITGLAGGIADAVRAVVNPIITIIDAFIGFINILITGVDKVIGAIPFVGKGLQIGKIPSIPHLYQGAIASGSSAGTLAIVGDKNQDEAIVPLPRDWRTKRDGKRDGRSVTINQYLTTNATPDAINRAALRGLRTSGVTAQ